MESHLSPALEGRGGGTSFGQEAGAFWDLALGQEKVQALTGGLRGLVQGVGEAAPES